MKNTDLKLERSALRQLNLRILPFVLLLYVIAMIDRTNVGFAALQMNEDLGFSATVFGFGAGIFFLGYALFEVPSNLILARVGTRKWIARILFTWGLIATAMMFVEGPMRFYVLRFLLGVAEAGFLPGILYYLSHWYPAARRAQAVAWFMVGIPLAQVVGAPLAGWLLGFDGVLGLYGWQWMYLVEGLPAVFLSAVVFRLLPDAPRDATWLSDAERDWLETRIAGEHSVAAARHGSDVLRALRHPVVWMLGFFAFAFQTGSYGLQFWTPQLVKSWSGLDPLGVGLLTAIPYLGAAVGMVLIGRSSDRTGERFLHIAIPTGIAAVAFAVAGFIVSPVLGIIMLTIAAVGDMGTRGPFWALPTRFLTGGALAGGIALINTMGSLGGFVGPYAVGVVKDATGLYGGGLLFMAVLLAIGVVIALRLRHRDELQPITASGH